MTAKCAERQDVRHRKTRWRQRGKGLKEKEQDAVGSEPGCIFEWIGTLQVLARKEILHRGFKLCERNGAESGIALVKFAMANARITFDARCSFFLARTRLD